MILLRAALNLFSTQPAFVIALCVAELHDVCTGPPLKPVQVPQDGTPSLQRADCTTQPCVIDKLAQGALNPTVHIADKSG